MKRFLLSLSVLLISFPALAEGGYHDQGGCTDEQLNGFCSMIGFLLVSLVVLVLVFSVYHNYKMKTDPVYRAHQEQLMREYEEKHRGY